MKYQTTNIIMQKGWCSYDGMTSVTAVISSYKSIVVTWSLVTLQGPVSLNYTFEVECNWMDPYLVQRFKMIPVFDSPTQYSIPKCEFVYTDINMHRLNTNTFVIGICIKENYKILWKKTDITLRCVFTFGSSTDNNDNVPNKRKKTDSVFRLRLITINKNAKVLVAELKEIKNKLDSISTLKPIPEELKREYKQKLVQLEELKNAISMYNE